MVIGIIGQGLKGFFVFALKLYFCFPGYELFHFSFDPVHPLKGQGQDLFLIDLLQLDLSKINSSANILFHVI